MQIQYPPKLKPLFQRTRYKILYGGRGGAKSWGIARALLDIGLDRPIRVLCTREIQKTIAESVHKLLSDQIASLGLDGFYVVRETSIVGKNGTEFAFAGIRGQDIAKIKSYEGVDICWVEEAHVVPKKSWDVLIPTIRKPDSEIWVSFNPELDTDETYQRFVANPPEGAFVCKLTYRDNPWFPAVLEKERLALKVRDPEAYDNVWEGNCRSAVEGAIYAREIQKLVEERRLRDVPYDPLLKVHAVWDLGWNDQMSIILAQRVASEIRIIEYIEDRCRTLDSYISDLRGRPYRWGRDYIPHDGRAKDYKYGRSAEEILTSLGREVEVVENLDVETGIKAARLLFPRCYFDQKAQRLVHCLKRYRRQINQTTNEPGAPLHDEFSHGADAFRYLGIVADQMKNEDMKISDPYKGFRRYG